MAEDVFDRRQSSSEEFLKNETNPVPLRLVGPYEKVPNWKCVDFWMGGASSKFAVGGDKKVTRKNWRSNSYGGIDFSSNPVNENVLLIPDGMRLEVSGGMDLSEVSESIGKGDDLLSILAEATAIFNSSISVPQYKPRVLSGFKLMSMPQSFKFKFHYGAAGLYDAFEEVVKPIYALVGFFGVNSKYVNANGVKVDSTKLDSATISTGLPYPTKGKFIFEKIRGCVLGIKTMAEKGFNGLADMNAQLQSALASGAAGIALSEGYYNLWISWGRFTLGPFQYTDIKYSFDMDQFDSNGWPLNGEFEVGGISSMRVSSGSAMISPVIIGA